MKLRNILRLFLSKEYFKLFNYAKNKPKFNKGVNR